MTGHENSWIEFHENYSKQSYRNRCIIYGANGPLPLTVPVERGSFHKVAVKDIRTDSSRNWQVLHRRALSSAYNTSAFFEYYFDDIEKFFIKKFDFLFDLNLEIINAIADMIGMISISNPTETFRESYNLATDYRYQIHPKKRELVKKGNIAEYFQVFSPGSGFVPDLSILDLLFNMGPESFGYLSQYFRDTLQERSIG